MTGDLETAAADSVSHLARRRRTAPKRGALCANCGARLHGPFCHDCGQDSDSHKRTILHLLIEAAEGLFDLDGRLVRTLPALFFRPGRLARDYMEGRIQRHVPPFRTFLVSLLLFIFAAEHAAHEITVANARQKAAEAAELATPQGRAAVVGRMRAEATKDLAERLGDAAKARADDLKDPDETPARVEASYARSTQRAQARYARALAKADRVAAGQPPDPAVDLTIETDAGTSKTLAFGWKTDLRKAVANPDYYLSVVFAWGHRMAVLLLPIVGLSLALVYRKRRDVFLYDHLVVAMNLLSFGFLANGLGLVLPSPLGADWLGVVAIWTPINLFQTLRGAYGSGVLGALLKTLVVWTLTVTAFNVLLVGVFVFSLTQL